MVKKLDKATEKIFTTGERLKSLVENPGWQIAREMLIKKVAQQLNIADIGTASVKPEDVVLMVGIRQETAKALLEWLADVEGTAAQHKANIDAFAEVKDSYIIHVDDLQESN